MLSEDEYIALVGEALELLPTNMVIMRLLAEGRKEEILAPEWCFEKRRLNEKLETYFESHDIRQGRNFYRDLMSLSFLPVHEHGGANNAGKIT